MKPNFSLLLFLSGIGIILISGCVAEQGNVQVGDVSKGINDFLNKPAHGLGELCTGSECDSYCLTYSLECEDYCRQHHNNTMCQERFSWVISGEQRPDNTLKGHPTYQKQCSGTGTVQFTSPPRKLEDIELIEPIGLMSGGHVTPIDHGYYYPPNWNPRDDPSKFSDVMAPADGVITEISLINNIRGDYRMLIHHTCTFYTIYIHLKELSPRISQITGEITRHTYPNIRVTAGETIGRANSFDFSVHDEEVTLSGFVVPGHYTEPWKIHTVDMFDHFVEPIRSQLLAKNVRQAEPRGGKIDYDIDGRLVGNWFVENTGGYGGTGTGDYWMGHLTFAYDGLEPSMVIISTGNYSNEAKQYAVKGNAPDPATISVASGLVKYELVSFDYVTSEGQIWNRISFAKITGSVRSDYAEGVILVQMIEDRKIKVEVFPGKTASEVNGFTNNAKIYER